MKERYDKLILVGYFAAVAILAVIGVTSFRSTSNYIDSDKDITETHKIIETLTSLQFTIKDAENSQKGYIITDKNTFLDPFISSRSKITKSIGVLRVLLSGNEEQTGNISKLDTLIRQKTEVLYNGIFLRSHKEGFDEAARLIASDTGKVISDSINSIIGRITADMNLELAQKEKKMVENAGNTGKFYSSGIVISIILVMLTYFLHLSDTRKRNLIERKLQDSQRRYKMIARNFPDGTINVLDRTNIYVFADGKEFNKYEILPEDLIGKSYLDRFQGEKRNEIQTRLSEVFDRKSQTVNYEFVYKGLLYSASAVALWNRDKTDIDELLLVEQNITSQKRAEQDVLNSLEKEKHLNELTSLIVSIASHEFRTPLGTIISSTELLEKYIRNGTDLDYIREKSNKHLTRIKSSVDHLVEILNSFISLEKLEQGKIEVKPTLFNIALFSEDVVDEINSGLKKGQQIQYAHTGVDTGVFLDQQMVKNIVINLLSNASKYSSEGSIIEYSTFIQDKVLEIKVTDHGMGIPESDQAHLFENFFRAKNALTIRGTGLGLNIVKRYTDLMNGKITFESKEGVGTTFTINIPLGIILT